MLFRSMNSNLYTINVSVANLYERPDFNSPVVTQGLLGEECDILDEKNNWVKIRQWDKYVSWMNRFSGFANTKHYSGSHFVMDLHGIVFQNIAHTIPIRDVTFGSKLDAVPLDEANTYSVQLPDGSDGYYRGDLMHNFPDPTREELVLTAKRFLGSPYIWGGKSPKGFDCSGFVQTVFHSLGIDLPRDAIQQYECLKVATVELNQSLLGDLHFFGTEESITHVGMVVEGNTFIHTQGYVKEESLDAHSTMANMTLIEKRIATCSIAEVLLA